jgi:hypothetical protein
MTKPPFRVARASFRAVDLAFELGFAYCPRIMSCADRFIRQMFFAAAGGLLLMAAGCGSGMLWQRSDPSRTLDSTKVSELRPGSYCEIEMVVPLTAPQGSFQCYKGTVKEITHEEVVLTDAVEESQIDYGGSGRHREPTQKKHDLVRVPLTGVNEIWALHPSKDGASPPAGSAAAPAAAIKLPSAGAHPVPLPDDQTARFD